MTAQSETSRRLFLAAGSAATVFGALTQAVAQGPKDADPIFAAIERHKAALSAFEATCDLTDEVRADEQGREVAEADSLQHEAAGDAEIEALEALIETLPATKAGARAAIEWLAYYDRGYALSHVGQFAMTLLRSPVLADLEAQS